jgi:hypothetical protein
VIPRRRPPELDWLMGWLTLFAKMVTPLRHHTIRKDSGCSFASRKDIVVLSECFFINIKFAPIGKQD